MAEWTPDQLDRLRSIIADSVLLYECEACGFRAAVSFFPSPPSQAWDAILAGISEAQDRIGCPVYGITCDPDTESLDDVDPGSPADLCHGGKILLSGTFREAIDAVESHFCIGEGVCVTV
jgi:hypothetical protein